MIRVLMLAAVAVLGGVSAAHAHDPHTCPDGFPDAPILSGHIEHGDIVDATPAADIGIVNDRPVVSVTITSRDSGVSLVSSICGTPDSKPVFGSSARVLPMGGHGVPSAIRFTPKERASPSSSVKNWARLKL